MVHQTLQLEKKLPLTRAYCHLLTDVQLAGFAPAFTFSLSESEYSRIPIAIETPMPIASVVMGKCKKKEREPTYENLELKTNLYSTLQTIC